MNVRYWLARFAAGVVRHWMWMRMAIRMMQAVVAFARLIILKE